VLQVRSNPATSQVDVITADTLAELADKTRHREFELHTLNSVTNTCCGPLTVITLMPSYDTLLVVWSCWLAF
jgi:hypothetical protein